MMDFQILQLDTQRNGVSGNPFLSIVLRIDDGDGFGPVLVLTVEQDGEDPDRGYDFRSCRVINPFDLSDHYRGDLIAERLSSFFAKYGRPESLTEKILTEGVNLRLKRTAAFPDKKR